MGIKRLQKPTRCALLCWRYAKKKHNVKTLCIWSMIADLDDKKKTSPTLVGDVVALASRLEDEIDQTMKKCSNIARQPSQKSAST
jgi:hypothetical protein